MEAGGAEGAEQAAAVNGAAPHAEERRERRRGLGTLLSAYYGIEGAQASAAPAGGRQEEKIAPMDRKGFDARAHFDGIVATGEVSDVLRSANDVDAQVKDLDGDMQMVCYENYSKFIRATEVTGQVRSSVHGMEPDIARLEGSFGHISEHQRRVEDIVSGRAREIDLLLKRQRRCKKLQVLFELPTTLQRCLDREAYGRACEAYCMCTPFLRQYKHIATFKSVLEAAELQMGRIKTALEWRLRSPELCSRDAMNSSTTLLDLGDTPSKVARDFLSGRGVALRSRLSSCFAELGELPEAEAALSGVCERIASDYVPELVDAVDGFNKLQKGCDAFADDFDPEASLSDFVSSAVEALCTRLAQLVERRRPPAGALVASVQALRHALRRLHSLMPRLLAKLFTAFLGRVTGEAARSVFAAAAAGTFAELVVLHGECTRLPDPKASASLDAVLAAVSRTEDALAGRAEAAVGECEPLLGLIESDGATCQQLVQVIQAELSALSGAFCEACRTAAAAGGEEPPLRSASGAAAGAGAVRSAASASRARPAELEVLAGLEWNGLFALGLVWLGRRLEEKVLSKAWDRARELFEAAGLAPGTVGGELELAPGAGAAADIAAAAEATLSHFVLVSGQHLAHSLRDSLKRKDWANSTRAPAETSLFVEATFKEVHTLDLQLGRMLIDPRKARGGGAHRRNFNLGGKSSMELEIERQWAKKLQVFAAVPFKRSGAVAGVLRIAFKALFEYAREETFATFGLQQLQLDAELLGELSRDFVENEDAAVLGSLLDEAVGSASQRCEAPALMEASAVEAICDQRKRSLRLEY